MRVYPGKQQAPVIQILSEFILSFQRMPEWRALDEEEMQALEMLKQVWVYWCDDAMESEGSAIESEGDVVRQASPAEVEYVKTISKKIEVISLISDDES